MDSHPGTEAGYPTLTQSETLTLRARQVAVRSAVGPQMAHDAEWLTYPDRFTDRMVIQLRSYVYGHKLEEITKDIWLTYPANWWQHLRLRVLDERGRLDRLILRRWPIRYEREHHELTVERWDMFPDNEHVYPDSLGRVVRMQVQA